MDRQCWGSHGDLTSDYVIVTDYLMKGLTSYVMKGTSLPPFWGPREQSYALHAFPYCHTKIAMTQKFRLVLDTFLFLDETFAFPLHAAVGWQARGNAVYRLEPLAG